MKRPIQSGAPAPLDRALARCGLLLLLYLALCTAVQGVAGAVLGRLWPGASYAEPIGLSEMGRWLLWLAGDCLALGAPVLLYLWRGGMGRLWGRRSYRPVSWAVVPVFLGLGRVIALGSALLGEKTGLTARETPLPDTLPALVVAFFALCVVPAVLEELLFRGALAGWLRPFGAGCAIVGSAVLFALLHSGLPAILYALWAGLFLAWLAEACGSLLPGMALHFLNNALNFWWQWMRRGGSAQQWQTAVMALLLVGGGFAAWWLTAKRRWPSLPAQKRKYALWHSSVWWLIIICLLALRVAGLWL